MANQLTPKYKVGDTVYYVNLIIGEVEARVKSVQTEIVPGVPGREPVYLIDFIRPPMGFAAALERELTAEPRKAETA